MPRRQRLHLPNVPLHIVLRGHNREACFFADDNYLAYLQWLDDTARVADSKLDKLQRMVGIVIALAIANFAKQYLQRHAWLGQFCVSPNSVNARWLGCCVCACPAKALTSRHAKRVLALCLACYGKCQSLNQSSARDEFDDEMQLQPPMHRPDQMASPENAH